MNQITWLSIFSLLFISTVHCSTTLPDCPACVSQCPVLACDCTDSHGNILAPPPNPPQPPRPEWCPPCSDICPLVILECNAPLAQCTPEQLTTFVPKCPECVLFAGCKQTGCDCKDCSGNLLTPPTNPPQPPRPTGCPNCTTICPKELIVCPPPRQCTVAQLNSYVPECPECVGQAGCPQFGCACTDCYGDILIPPKNPPQPPRPIGCPKCSIACIVSDIKCPAPVACTPEQLKTFVPEE